MYRMSCRPVVSTPEILPESKYCCRSDVSTWKPGAMPEVMRTMRCVTSSLLLRVTVALT